MLDSRVRVGALCFFSIMEMSLLATSRAALNNDAANPPGNGPVRPLPTSYIDGEGRRSAEGKESHSLRQDATVLAVDLATACSVSCEYGPRDRKLRIHFQAFSDARNVSIGTVKKSGC